MKLYNYKRKNNFWLVRDINQFFKELGTPLTSYQSDKLEEFLDGESGAWYEYLEVPKTTLKWRLTAPFLVIVMLLSVVYMPIKFLFTGKFYYSLDSDNWLVKWARKVNIPL